MEEAVKPTEAPNNLVWRKQHVSVDRGSKQGFIPTSGRMTDIYLINLPILPHYKEVIKNGKESRRIH